MPRISISSATRNSASNAIMKWPIAIEHAADDDGAALAEHAVGEEAAEDRRGIGKAGIEAEQLRGEGLHVERPEQRFERALDRAKPEHGLDLARLQADA